MSDANDVKEPGAAAAPGVSAGERSGGGRAAEDPAITRVGGPAAAADRDRAGVGGDGGLADGAVDTDAADDDDAASEAAVEDDIEQLLARAQEQRDEYLDLARRTQADFENFRKRSAREAAEARARGAAEVIRELLPVIDNLERALAAFNGLDATERLAEGLKMVHADFAGVIARLGVEIVEPAGERFDPNVHEALTTRAQDGVEPGVVLDVVEKGYMIAGAVLRPARVVVSA